MAVASKVSGAQLAVITTEHDLATITDPGAYSLKTDLSALTATDTVEIRVYTKVRSEDSEKLEKIWTISGILTSLAGAEQVIASYPFVTDCHLRFTLKQTEGTGRTIPWNILIV